MSDNQRNRQFRRNGAKRNAAGYLLLCVVSLLAMWPVCIYIIIMDYIHFEWDDNKEKENIKKHKISFDEAKTVFGDPNALLIHDPDHSDEEDRFILMGMSQTAKVLVVCHCFRGDESIIRIISARKADKQEEKLYGERL